MPLAFCAGRHRPEWESERSNLDSRDSLRDSPRTLEAGIFCRAKRTPQ